MAKKEKSSSNDLSGKRVAFLGAGKMGGILLQALLKHGMLSPNLTCATVAHEERAKALASKWNVKVGTSNPDAVKGADIIVIGVKPQVVQDVVKEISRYVTPKQLIISVAASFPTSLIEKALADKVPVVRAMPNTPCSQGAGMTAVCKGAQAVKDPKPHEESALVANWITERRGARERMRVQPTECTLDQPGDHHER